VTIPPCRSCTHNCWLVDGETFTSSELRARGYALGIASNFDERLVGVCRGHAALADLPLFGSSDVGYSKPHPQFFARVAARLALAPREILLVGDDWEADFQGALAAGWQAIYIDRAAGLAHGDEFCRHLAELPGRIFGRA
jgi:FMN phosphatase YigB (HAD superfamily)